MKAKAFISGAISSDPDYHQKFSDASMVLIKQGYTVMSPAVLPYGFEQEKYLHICEAMIDCCEVVVFLPDWSISPGAIHEMFYAKRTGKRIAYLTGKTVVYHTFLSESQQKLYD